MANLLVRALKSFLPNSGSFTIWDWLYYGIRFGKYNGTVQVDYHVTDSEYGVDKEYEGNILIEVYTLAATVAGPVPSLQIKGAVANSGPCERYNMYVRKTDGTIIEASAITSVGLYTVVNCNPKYIRLIGVGDVVGTITLNAK